MGEVLAGHDERLQRPVAIKRLRSDRTSTEERRERLEGEARLHARLSHPNVVQVFDFVTSDGVDHLVTEYVVGRSLAELCAAKRPAPKRALEILVDVARGLDAAHQRGIIHCDLKLENVLVGEDGSAKIVDFGIALSDADPLRVTGFGAGTMRAMSPEQALNLGTDARSDLFSFGVLAYELLSGVSPFAAPTDAQVRENLTTRAHRSLAEVEPSVRAEVSTFVDRLLEKSPELRPATAREAVKRLEGFAARERDAALTDEPAVLLRHVAVVALRVVPEHGDLVESARRLASLQRRVRELAEECQAHVSMGYGHETVVCFGYPKKHGDNCEVAATFAAELVSTDSATAAPSLGIDVGVVAVLEQPSGTVLVGQVLAGATALAQRAAPSATLVTARAQTILSRSFRVSPCASDDVEDATSVAYRLGALLD